MTAVTDSAPGGGCTNPNDIHDHWCGSCGAAMSFSRVVCQLPPIMPACPHCGVRDWRDSDPAASADPTVP
jgi:hypothetical protein